MLSRRFLVLLTCLGPLLTPPPLFSNDPVFGPGGHFYQAIQSPSISWNDAHLAASSILFQGRPGHLATIATAEEDNFVNEVRIALVGAECSGAVELWLGGYQDQAYAEPGGGWFWINDEGPIEGYTNCIQGEPNNSSALGEEEYLALGSCGVFGWNDEGYVGNIGGFVVEFDSGVFADAGLDQVKTTCSEIVHLDAGASQPNDALFHWTIVSKPGGSLAAIDDQNTRTPSFVADLPGTYLIQLTVSDGDYSASDELLVRVSCPVFRRGDSNGAGRTDLADAVYTLDFLFQTGEPIRCTDAADANDDGTINIADPVYVLLYLFLGAAPPPLPGSETCGPDPTADQLQECRYLPENCRP